AFRALWVSFDVLAELGYGLAPRTRRERAEAFTYKHADWLSSMPAQIAATVTALAGQFAKAGIEVLENPQLFNTPAVKKAGGLKTLQAFGKPLDMLRETKERLFTV